MSLNAFAAAFAFIFQNDAAAMLLFVMQRHSKAKHTKSICLSVYTHFFNYYTEISPL